MEMHSLRNTRIQWPLFLAMAISRFGDRIYQIGLPILIYREYKTAYHLAGLAVFEAIPLIIFPIIFGSLSDRYYAKRMMVLSDLIRCGLAILPVFYPHLILIYIIAFLLTTASQLFNPNYQRYIAQLYEKAELSKINAISVQFMTAIKIIGPIVGAYIAVKAPPATFFIINSITFLISAIIISILPNVAPKAISKRTWGYAVIRETVQIYRTNLQLLRCLSSLLIISIGLGTLPILLPIFIVNNLNVTLEHLGTATALEGAGAFIGGVVFVYIRKMFNTTMLMRISFIILSIAFVSLAPVNSIYIFLAILFFIGLIASIFNISWTTTVQTNAPEDAVGLVFGTMMPIGSLAFILAASIAPLVERLGAAYGFVIVSGTVLSALIFDLYISRNGRQAGEHSEEQKKQNISLPSEMFG
jgi:MFS family permease